MSTADAVIGGIPEIEGNPPSVLIITAPYYREVVESMAAGARAVLDHVGAEHETVEVAGAFELPQALRIAAATETPVDGFILIGCVVNGETDHYEFICDSVMHGILQVATAHRLATGTAVLTVDTLGQAMARSHETGANKGAEAAAACLGQIALKRRFGA